MGLVTSIGDITICKEIVEDYTINEGDYRNVLVFNANNNLNCVIPGGLRVGFSCIIIQKGNGVILFASQTANLNIINGQYANIKWQWISILCIAENDFIIDFSYKNTGGGETSPIPNLQEVTDEGNFTENNIRIINGKVSQSTYDRGFAVQRQYNVGRDRPFFDEIKIGADANQQPYINMATSPNKKLSITAPTLAVGELGEVDDIGNAELYIPFKNGTQRTLVTLVNGVAADANGEINLPTTGNGSTNNTQSGSININTSNGETKWKILSLPLIDEGETPPLIGSHYCTGLVDIKASVLALDPNFKQDFFLFLEKLAFVYNPFKDVQLQYNLVHGNGFIENKLQEFNYYRKGLEEQYYFSAEKNNINEIDIFLNLTPEVISEQITLEPAFFNIQYSYSYAKFLFIPQGSGGNGGGEV